MNTDAMKAMLPFQGGGIGVRIQTQGVGLILSKTVAIGLGYNGLSARKPGMQTSWGYKLIMERTSPAFDCFALRQRRAT